MSDSPTELEPRDERVRVVHALRALLISPPDDGDIQLVNITHTLGILSKIERILGSNATSQCLVYLLMKGASTEKALEVHLGIPESSAYRSLRTLTLLGYVEPQLKFTNRVTSHAGNRGKGGPRPIVWGVLDCSKTQVAEALNLHARCMSPKYRVASEIAQTILDEYSRGGRPEITYRDLLSRVRELKIPYVSGDVAELTARYLAENGMKVWR